MIRDLRRILGLISDLISLYHPITLDIRWQFYLMLSRISYTESWGSREQWEEIIRRYDCTLGSFIRVLLKNQNFRENIIKVLEFEKDKLLREYNADLENLYLFSKEPYDLTLEGLIVGTVSLYPSFKFLPGKETSVFLELRNRDDTSLLKARLFLESIKCGDFLLSLKADRPLAFSSIWVLSPEKTILGHKRMDRFVRMNAGENRRISIQDWDFWEGTPTCWEICVMRPSSRKIIPAQKISHPGAK